jgi:hypothetical protein
VAYWHPSNISNINYRWCNAWLYFWIDLIYLKNDANLMSLGCYFATIRVYMCFNVYMYLQKNACAIRQYFSQKYQYALIQLSNAWNVPSVGIERDIETLQQEVWISNHITVVPWWREKIRACVSWFGNCLCCMIIYSDQRDKLLSWDTCLMGSFFFPASNYFCIILDLEMSESDIASINH